MRIKRLIIGIIKKPGVSALFAGLALVVTAGTVLSGTGSFGWPTTQSPLLPFIIGQEGGPVKISATLSNPYVVQHADGTVYLDLAVTTPALKHDSSEEPIDLFIILDRSGSMAEDNKWSYATGAIRKLVSQLDSNDRTALITFSHAAQVYLPLVEVNRQNWQQFERSLVALRPNGATNLGAAMQLAQRMVEESTERERGARIIVLSDGETNRGMTGLQQLGRLARQISDSGAAISTIGMGLGFNEYLLARIADEGMGRFDYLESLAGLDNMLIRELRQSQQLYSDFSEIEIRMSDGVEVVSAADYPIARDGNVTTIRFGQLADGTTKPLLVKLRVPTERKRTFIIEDVRLKTRTEGRIRVTRLKKPLQVACIDSDNADQAKSALNHTVMKKAWRNVELGGVMQQYSADIKAGKLEVARQRMKNFRREARAASVASPGLIDKDMNRELKALEEVAEQVEQSANPVVEQERLAKSIFKSAKQKQRQ